MAIDWTKLPRRAQLATSTGTGDFVLRTDVLVNNYSVLTADNDGETIYYLAQPTTANDADDQWEEGYGVYTHGTKTQSRTTITGSSTGSKIDFTSAPTVAYAVTSDLVQKLDTILNLTGAGTAAGSRAALGLAIGTDVLAEQTIGIANDNLLEVDGTPLDAEVAVFTANGIDGKSEAEFKALVNLEDADINTLVNARIAALQASGDLPPDPSTLVEGDMIAVNALGKYAKVG